LSASQSLSFLSNPSAEKLTFVGDQLGNNFDPLQFTMASSYSTQTYQNKGTSFAAPGGSITWIQEPAELLTLTSQIPNAFLYAGQSSSTAAYVVNPYQLNEIGNSVTTNGPSTNVIISYPVPSNSLAWITSSNPLLVTVKGYTSNTASAVQATDQATFTSAIVGAGAADNSLTLTTPLYNVTSISLNKALPGAFRVTVGNTLVGLVGNTMATLAFNATPNIEYLQGTTGNYSLTSGSSLPYNQQNGQTSATFTTTTVAPSASAANGVYSYATFNVVEYPVATNTAMTDQLSFSVENNTGGTTASPILQLNYSFTGGKNNMTYLSGSSQSLNAPVGFRTERGSQVASITPTSVTIDYAKAVDLLQFVVSTSNTVVSSTTHTIGPIGIGQAVPGLPNTTVSNVVATCSGAVSNSVCSVSGLGNLTATPSALQAVVPVKWNTVTTPAVVLDSNANNASTLIVVGSKFVNSVAAQIFAQNPSLDSSFGPTGTDSVIVQSFGQNRILVAGYTANQTVQAGNEFIQNLLSAATT